MKIIILEIFILFFLMQIDINGQGISYIWPNTGKKIDIEITYLSDSSYTLIKREASNTLNYDSVNPLNTLVFWDDRINEFSELNRLSLQSKKYAFVPFDPDCDGLVLLNSLFSEYNHLIFSDKNSDDIESRAPGEYEIYWCSCSFNTEDPGDCLATLETVGGFKMSRCINDGECDECVGWLGELQTEGFKFKGGGLIVEIKGQYAHNLSINN